MNTVERLTQLWLCEIPQTRYMDGFDKTLVFVFSREIAEHMQKILETPYLPEIAILRWGMIENRGIQYSRLKRNHPMPYSLCYFDDWRWKFSCVIQKKDGVEQKAKWIHGKKHHYLLNLGKAFTAQKYFDWWKKLQENPNRINLHNL